MLVAHKQNFNNNSNNNKKMKQVLETREDGQRERGGRVHIQVWYDHRKYSNSYRT